jgi:hypothetical protein
MKQFSAAPAKTMAMYRSSSEDHLKSCQPYAKFCKQQQGGGLSYLPLVVDNINSPSVSTLTGSGSDGRTMCDYGMSRLEPSQLARSEKLFLEWTVDAAIPFDNANRKSFHRFLDSVRPGVSNQLSRKIKLRTTLLNNAAAEAVSDSEGAIREAKTRGHRAGLIVDGWTSVNRLCIEGVLLTLRFLVFLLPSVLGGAICHGVAVAMFLETLLYTSYEDKHQF